MKRVKLYEEIADSPIIYEVDSINKPKIKTFMTVISISLVNLLILLAYFLDALLWKYLINEINFLLVFVFEIIFIASTILPVILLDNARSMRLIFTKKGIALYPNSFICGIPLSTLVAESWDDIESYSFLELAKLMALGIDPNKRKFLYIRTNGLIPRCVNNYGISVFAVTGHLLNEKDISVIRSIFDQFGIKNEQEVK